MEEVLRALHHGIVQIHVQWRRRGKEDEEKQHNRGDKDTACIPE